VRHTLNKNSDSDTIWCALSRSTAETWCSRRAWQTMQQQLSNVLLITIEGCMGAGKSNLIKHLKTLFSGKLGIVFVDEPLEQWTRRGFLQGLYDGTVDAGSFQHMVLQSLASDLRTAIEVDKASVIISERGLQSSYEVFAKATMQGTTLDMYEYTWDKTVATLPLVSEARHLYLRVTPDVAYQRILLRNRPSERNVNMEYTRCIVDLHERWLCGSNASASCVSIDATQNEPLVHGTCTSVVSGWIIDACQRNMRPPHDEGQGMLAQPR